MCREFATKWIDIQRQEFKNLGCVAEWDKPYITMNPTYEASILRAFAKFVEQGYIERKGKTVPWCMSCQTVLAAAEIEYKDRKDPSLYVKFLVDRDVISKVFPIVYEQTPDLETSFLIWTTTPWTLPLNRAVALNPTATYVLLQGRQPNEAFIVGQELADIVCKNLEIEKKILAEGEASVFAGIKIHHPIVPNLYVPIILDDTVQLTEGTACLHSAPGCGPEDYLMAIKHGLEIFSPLSADGRYTKGIAPQELEGMLITDGQIWVLKYLTAQGSLVYKKSITHSYPHCWRCRNGLMFRATDQWFCNLDKNNLVQKVLSEIKNITFIPEWGRTRLDAFIGNRTEWCISRQRNWGVPIPAVLCDVCGHAFLDANFIKKIADKVAQDGIEFWDLQTPEKLVKDGALPQDFACAKCHNNDVTKFRLDRDILDVWFDSGVSHYAVLAQDKRLGVPCDLYLEGSDQHRGWFQSSLLCAMVLHGKSQTKAILTHGFTVDKNKNKMSKSLGNVVAPQEVIDRYSRDILRLWVASSDFENDIVYSEQFVNNVAEVYRKIRNTCRFMISNLYDFDLKKDAVTFERMFKIDQYILARLYDVREQIIRDYNNYYFAGVVQTLNNFCANDLSAMYLDILKDRLYVEKPDSRLRRSGQTAMFHILDMLTHLMAPILSFVAEEVSDFYIQNKKDSIHLSVFPEALDVWKTAFMEKQRSHVKNLYWVKEGSTEIAAEAQHTASWLLLEELRTVVLKAIEEKRKQDVVRHSLESKVTLFIAQQGDDGAYECLQAFMQELSQTEDVNRFFKDWFIVSQFSFAPNLTGLDSTSLPWVFVKVEHADGTKCPRCWQWDQAVQADETTPPAQALCRRCKEILVL
ncbi:MAG: isoleucine--tRNA ligase, partial [bacterium]